MNLNKIRSNIREHGHHVTVVTGGPLPTFAYTIGAQDRIGVEFVAAGLSYLPGTECGVLLNKLVTLARSRTITAGDVLQTEDGVELELREIQGSWKEQMLLGVLDVYHGASFSALQVCLRGSRITLDTPDMRKPFDPGHERCWRWLTERWDHPFPEKSRAITNLAALRGDPITEGTRWEENEWEIFSGAGPDVDESEVRSVPLATLLAIDPTLGPMTECSVGRGVWRSGIDSAWSEWK